MHLIRTYNKGYHTQFSIPRKLRCMYRYTVYTLYWSTDWNSYKGIY